MPRIVDTIYTTPTVAAGEEDNDVFSKVNWVQAGPDEVGIVTEFGVFGDQTSGTKWEAWSGQEFVGEGPPHYTSFNRDYITNPNWTIEPGQRLRLKMKNAAASDQTYDIKIRIEFYNFAELG
mgnify:CR=1 FL=1